jgi:NADH-quinone oxidoreductase subunit M
LELLLLILPVFFALSALVVPQSFVRAYGILGAIATLVVAAVLAAQYDPQSGYHAIASREWLPGLGMTFTLGYDGMSMMMVLLTTGLVPLILLSNFRRELAHSKAFTSMVFFMQFGLLGVFIAMDGILFYIFWEITLIPIYLICLWFGEPDRKAALTKFFIYTFFGSLFMLASLIGLRAMGANSFEIGDLIAVDLSNATQTACWLMGGFFLAFAVKVPLFPFHTWQPDTYTKSPMAGTMLLSGIMLKMALYGMIRWMLPLFIEAKDDVTMPIIILGTIGVLYGAILAIKEQDMKRLFAFSSLSHVGLIAAGIMTFNSDTLSGAIVQMINHGLVAVGLFLAADIFERRLGTRQLGELGGTAKIAPKFGFWFAVIVFASVSVPLTSGFIGEFLLLKGLYNYNWIVGIVAGTTLIFGAVYTLRANQLSMYGPVKVNAFADLHWSELLVFAVITIVVVVLGICPQLVIGYVEPGIRQLLETVQSSTPLVP